MYCRIKYIVIIVIAVFIDSCSVTRTIEEGKRLNNDTKRGEVIEDTYMSENLSKNDFVFGRMRIDIETSGERQSLNGFLKYKKSGKILVSIRSVAGIEIARLLVTKDSIQFYDKINYILYKQDVDYIEQKYGLTYNSLALLWGDFPDYLGKKISEKYKENELTGNIIYNNMSYDFELDPEYDKLKSISILRSNKKSIRIIYTGYKTDDKMIYPGAVKIADEGGSISMDIEYSGLKRERVKNMRFNTLNKKEIKILR